MGYEGQLIITNIGSVFLIMVLNSIFVTLIIIAPCLRKVWFFQKLPKFLLKYIEGKYNELRWNGTIDFYYSGYFFFSLMGWIAIRDLRFGSQYTSAE